MSSRLEHLDDYSFNDLLENCLRTLKYPLVESDSESCDQCGDDNSLYIFSKK